jgi:PTS system beta-glucosides-specific IIC component
VSPIEGDVVALADVKDEVFSSGILGKGVAVNPTKGELFSPVDGEVILVPDSKHSVAVLDATGAEILMHIGMDKRAQRRGL